MRTISHFIAALSAICLSACVNTELPGTQVGVEDDLGCQEISTETLADLDAVPDDFESSPADMLAGLVGGFSGAQLDEQEQPTSDLASLVVSEVGAEVVLVRYEAVSTDGDEPAGYCPATMFTDLGFVLEADGLPAFEATLATRLNAEGEGWADVEDDTGFESELPEPTSFDPDDFDVVYPRVVFSGGSGSWWAYVSWMAYHSDEMASDGDVPLTDELLMMAAMDLD